MDDFLYDEFYRIERTHWWAVGMRGIFHALLRRALADIHDPALLDVGCGTGITLEEFGRYGRIIGTDIAWKALQYDRQRNPASKVVQADLMRLPIASSTMDAVLALDVIEHVEDDREALREIHRVLRSRGVVLVNVPAYQSLWSEKDTANHHYRRYTKSMLRRALEESGLRPERMTYTNAGLFLPIWFARQVQRRAQRPWSSDAEYNPNRWLNAALLGIMRLERQALRVVDLPFGTSVTCIARRLESV